MKNLMLATDLTSQSDRAFERAIKLTAMMKTKLHILHVCPSYSYADQKSRFSSLKPECRGYCQKSPERFRYWTAEGTAYSCLTQEAAALKPDLIAIGARGSAGGFTIDKLGGTAQSILTNPPCDVLVAKSI